MSERLAHVERLIAARDGCPTERIRSQYLETILYFASLSDAEYEDEQLLADEKALKEEADYGRRSFFNFPSPRRRKFDAARADKKAVA